MKSRLAALAIAALVVGTAALLWILSQTRHDRLAPPGEELVSDDFGFRIAGVRETPSITNPTGRLAAEGVFCVVALTVANHAVGVPYRMDQHHAILCDAAGRKYLVARTAQEALERGECVPRRAVLEPGEECTEEIVFEIPRDARELSLRISWGGPLVDAAEYVVFGDRRLALPAR